MIDLCAKRFDAFSVFYGNGAWKGIVENSMCIEIAILRNKYTYRETQQGEVVELAREIKSLNAQEAVLVEYIESTNVLI